MKFEQTNSHLEFLLRTECLLRPGPLWLFRVASDGIAYGSRSLAVRPGQKYIVVSTAGPLKTNNLAHPVSLACERVSSVMITLPPGLNSDWEQTVRDLGLLQARSVEVWPAGLDAVAWDGEGCGEWLPTERPCFAIRSDHPLTDLKVSLGQASLELGPILPDEPVFVELPQLPEGVHSARISVTSPGKRGVEPPEDLDLLIRIREARSPNENNRGPLGVLLDPAEPTLERFWEGQVGVELRGPRGRKVDCTVSLFDRDGGPPTLSLRLPPLPLPVGPADWRKHFDRHFREIRRAQETYDASRSCQLLFSAQELGQHDVRCDREFVPLRWAVRKDRRESLLRLIDDSGESDPPRISRFSFEKPVEGERIPCTTEFRPSPFGGLYFAQQGELTAAVIIAPVITDLSDFRCEPNIVRGERSVDAMVSALGLSALWGSARSSGNWLSVRCRREVLRTISRHALRLIGGERWAAAEEAVARGERCPQTLKARVFDGPLTSAMASEIAMEGSRLAETIPSGRVRWLSELASRFLPQMSLPGIGVSDPSWLTELALRISSDPAKVRAWAGDHLISGLERLFDIPVLIRAARFLVLLVHHSFPDQLVTGQVHTGWEWT